jgi:hypothetical protein
MEAQLEVPYRDTAAGDLVWRLGEARRPALATLRLELAGGLVELGLLGTSHQVVFTMPIPGGGRIVVSEVVACGAGAPGLPPAAAEALPDWDYRFRSATYRLAPDRFGDRVDGLAARLAGHPAAIVGRFPGSPHAVTALLAGPGPGGAGVRWRTWHGYPQDRCLVATSTVVRPR